MKPGRTSGFLLIALLLAACASPSSTPEAAQLTLINFFDHLARGEYSQAAFLYGGPYDQLQLFSPETNPGDTAALWQQGCEVGGLQCLRVQSATLEQETGGLFTFMVSFGNPDGSTFVLNPCCGADVTEMPPVSEFEYQVLLTPSGDFRVLDLPVYVP